MKKFTLLSLMCLSVACGPMIEFPTGPIGEIPSGSIDEIPSNGCPELSDDVLKINDNVLPAESCWTVSKNYTLKEDLVVKEGVTVLFSEGVALTVGPGSLKTEGTFEKPVYFTGTEETPGFWAGINFESRKSGNVLEYAVVEFAGGRSKCQTLWDPAALCLAPGSNAKIINTEIKDSKNFAITTTKDVDIEGFSLNTFTENERVLNLNPQNVRQLAGDSSYNGNKESVIKVRNLRYNDKLDKDGIWPVNPIPYYITGSIKIKSAIEIEAGAIFEFSAQGDIRVEVDGSLTAIGTQSDPIIFRGADSISGFWKGLYFESKTSKNILEHVEISNAGSTYHGAFTGIGGIAVYGGLLTLNSSNFVNNKESGVVIHNDGELNYCTLNFDNSGIEIDNADWRGKAGEGGVYTEVCD